MAWLMKGTNLSSIKNQLSTLAKEVLADVEENVKEVILENPEGEAKDLDKAVKRREDEWSQLELNAGSGCSQYVDIQHSDVHASLEQDERTELLARIQDLTRLLEKRSNESESQLTDLRQQNEELELQIKVLHDDKNKVRQKVKDLEKFEREAKILQKDLGDRINEEQKRNETMEDKLKSIETVLRTSQVEVDRLKRINEDLENKRISELKKLLEERESAERKVNELMEELANRHWENTEKEHAFDYDLIFEKLSHDVHAESCERAINFSKKVENLMKTVSNSDSSSIDALEDGLAQLAAYEEFDMLKSPKESSVQTDYSCMPDSTLGQLDMAISTESFLQKDQSSIGNQTDIYSSIDSQSQTEAIISSLEDVSSQTDAVEKETIDVTSQISPTIRDACTTCDVVHIEANSQTEVSVSNQLNQTESIQLTSEPSLAVRNIACTYSQTDNDSLKEKTTDLHCELSNFSSQTEIPNSDIMVQTELEQKSEESQTTAITLNDSFSMTDVIVSDVFSQTDAINLDLLKNRIKPIISLFENSSYTTILSQIQENLNRPFTEEVLDHLLSLIVESYFQLNLDLQSKLELQQQVDKFQVERNQLIQALQQKHQESVSYHLEVQKLSKALAESQRKRKNVVEVGVQFSSSDELQEELTQLKERENLLTSEAINLKQTIEKIRNCHNSELLSLKEKLKDAEEKLQVVQSNGEMEQKCALLSKRLNTLQQILDVVHKEKASEIQEATLRLRRQLENSEKEKSSLLREIEGLKTQIHELDCQLNQRGDLDEQLSKHRATVSTLQLQLDRNEKQKNELKAELSKLKESAANFVDRYLVANLICGYVSAPSSDKQRVLSLISNVLNFNSEEKRKCGMIEQLPVGDSKSLTAAFLEFLDTESKARPRLPPLPNP
ncbi:uncharacterized protein LOC136039413 isoform X2 [Artemia franciscana]|uniref:uncharacterized protein LOC136039413 isoform X2 n=1 Tax=Artemia franciscana TaxID=6661 RepID=UPI0032DA47D3